MLSIFSTIFSVVAGFFRVVGTFVWDFAKKWPWPTACLVLILVTGYLTNKWATERVNARWTAVEKVKEDERETKRKAREEKFKETKESSDRAALENQETITKLQAKIDSITGGYEEALEKARKDKKTEYVYIKVPGATAETSEILVQNGVVACRRLPNEFVDNINAMIDAANNGVSK